MIFITEIIDTALGGVGKLPSGKTVFIPFTVENDVVKAKITKETSSFATAELIEILEPSQYRCIPHCKYHGICGGCSFGHILYNKQLEIKKRFITNAFRKFPGELPEITIISNSPLGYRIRATVRTVNGIAGFFKIGTNELIPIDNCPVMSETLFEKVRAWVHNNKVNSLTSLSILETPDNETICSVSSKQKIININSPYPFTGIKAGDYPPEWRNNVITGKGIYGKSIIDYKTPAGTIAVTFNSFFQANKYLIPDFQKICTDILPQINILELYAGAGFFTSSLMQKADTVHALELNETAAKLGRIYGYPVTGGKAGEVFDTLKCDLLFMDPPREGADNATIASILKMLPAEIIYVSCNPATLGRDIMKLADFYAVDKITMFDMFPHTQHVESMTKLKRIK